MKITILILVILAILNLAYGASQNRLSLKRLLQIPPPPPTPDMRCVQEARVLHQSNSQCALGIDKVNLTCLYTDAFFRDCVEAPEAQVPLAKFLSCTMAQTFIDTLASNNKSKTGYQKQAGKLSIVQTNISILDSYGGKPIVYNTSQMPDMQVDYAFPQLFDGAGNRIIKDFPQPGGSYGGGSGKRLLLDTLKQGNARYIKQESLSRVATPSGIPVTSTIANAPQGAIYCQAFGRGYFNGWYIKNKGLVYDQAIVNAYFFNSTFKIVSDYPATSAPIQQQIVQPLAGIQASNDRIPASVQSVQSNQGQPQMQASAKSTPSGVSVYMRPALQIVTVVVLSATYMIYF